MKLQSKKALEIVSSLDKYDRKADELLKNLSKAEVKKLNVILDKIRDEN